MGILLLEQFVLFEVCLDVSLESWFSGETGGEVLGLLCPQLVLNVVLCEASRQSLQLSFIEDLCQPIKV